MKRVVKSSKQVEKEYEVHIYLNTAAADRGMTEPTEDDYIVYRFTAVDDYLAAITAISLVNDDEDFDYYAEEYPTLEEAMHYFEDQDWTSGETVVVELTCNGKQIYDSGYSKDMLIGGYHD